MKRLISFTFILLFLGVVTIELSAQTSGSVFYGDVSKLEIQLEGDGSQFSHMLPKEIKSEKELVFTKEASLYQKMSVDAEIDEMMESEEQGIKFMIEEPNDIYYADLATKETMEQKEFMSRLFLIKGKMEENAWKLTGKQKMILDYPCQEATTERDSAFVKAWFAPSIPVSAGPGTFSGLPGLILEVDIDNGMRTIIAQSLELKPVSAGELEKPKKGKKVSQEEFDAIVAEKMKEQGGEGGQGKMMMIEISQ